MKSYQSVLLFALAEIIVVTFILFTAQTLPANVASHFNGSGLPNGFMPRSAYTQFMLLFSVGIPMFVVFPIFLIVRTASSNINIPNKAYWLSAENKDSTMQFLISHVIGLGILIILFMAYVHWLILKANSVQPAQLPNNLLFIGMGVFLVSLLLWGAWLPVKFMRNS
jgi:uncharacterized membrane protein